MIVTCRTCGVDFENFDLGVQVFRFGKPPVHECADCFRDRFPKTKSEEDDEPSDLDATPIIENDDPDLYIPD